MAQSTLGGDCLFVRIAGPGRTQDGLPHDIADRLGSAEAHRGAEKMNA